MKFLRLFLKELLLADWSATLRYNIEAVAVAFYNHSTAFKMIIIMFLYRPLSSTKSVTILKSSLSVWLELSTNQLLKSKLIISVLKRQQMHELPS